MGIWCTSSVTLPMSWTSGAGRTTVVGFDGRRCGQPGGAQERFSMCLLSGCFLMRQGIDSREPR